jgi:drug/metabolite transporter (DMT)-like permease
MLTLGFVVKVKMKSPILVGALCLILAEAMFAGLGAMIKYLSTTLNQSQLVFFRNFFALLVLLPWVYSGGTQGLKTEKWGLHLLRATTGLISLYCFFYVLANIPLAQAMMALLIAPFFIPLIARLWLKESISGKSIVAVFIGFAGAALILRPAEGGINLYILLALLCALLVAISKCAIRKMSETEPSLRIVFYFTALATLISALPLLVNWQQIATNQWLSLLFMGTLASCGQLLMTKAFRLASPVKIGLLTYTNVLFASLLGYWFWHESVSPGLLVGMLLIILAANLTLRQRWFF